MCRVSLYEHFVHSFADHFADYCKLRGGVYFVDSLPTTASGKILRGKAKEIASAFYNARDC